MDEKNKARLDALDQKLKEVAQRNATPQSKNAAAQKFTAMSFAYRIVIEMAAGIGIGALMGLGLDKLFGTRPWFLVVMCMFGFAAGIKLMMESARQYQRQAQLNEEQEEENGRA